MFFAGHAGSGAQLEGSIRLPTPWTAWLQQTAKLFDPKKQQQEPEFTRSTLIGLSRRWLALRPVPPKGPRPGER